MNNDGVIGFGYLQARVQARFAQLAGNELWSRLGAIDEFSAYLEESRTTNLSPFIAGISADSNSHDIDLSVRRVFLHQLIELNSWMPKTWRSATLWLQWLPDIPLLSYLLEQQHAAPWMYHDKRLALMFKDQDVNVEQALTKAGAACLMSDGTSSASMFNMWLQHWPNLWPVQSGHLYRGIEELITLIHNYQVEFVALSCDQTWLARAELQQTLRLFFRRNLLQPAMAFAYLALISVQMERLRAELLQRLLYSQRSALV